MREKGFQTDAEVACFLLDRQEKEEQQQLINQRGDLLGFTDQDNYKCGMEENQKLDTPVKMEEPDSPSATCDTQGADNSSPCWLPLDIKQEEEEQSVSQRGDQLDLVVVLVGKDQDSEWFPDNPVKKEDPDSPPTASDTRGADNAGSHSNNTAGGCNLPPHLMPPDIKEEDEGEQPVKIRQEEEEDEQPVGQRGDLLDFTDQDQDESRMEPGNQDQNLEQRTNNPVNGEETDSPSDTSDAQMPQKKKSEKERSQAYRDRIKEDSEKYEERKKRDRERYLRKKERGVVKPISELPKREQRKKRRQGRSYMKKYRERIKNLQNHLSTTTPPNSPEADPPEPVPPPPTPPIPLPSAQKQRERKKVLGKRSKVYAELYKSNAKLEKALQNAEKYRKRYTRLLEKIKQADSPKSKSKKTDGISTKHPEKDIGVS